MIATCPTCGRENRVPAARLGDRARCGGCKDALLPLRSPVDVKSPADLDELVRSSPVPVIVDFWASWCGPCRMVAPELKKLASRYAGSAVVAKVNTEELQSLADHFRIRGIPTMIRFDRGSETKRISGAQPAEGIARSLGLPPAGPDVQPGSSR